MVAGACGVFGVSSDSKTKGRVCRENLILEAGAGALWVVIQGPKMKARSEQNKRSSRAGFGLKKIMLKIL